MPSEEYVLWTDIQDIVGQPIFGPNELDEICGQENLSHFNRIITAAFVWINGLNPEVFYDWCELKRFFSRGSTVHRHYQQLFTYFREGRRYRLW